MARFDEKVELRRVDTRTGAAGQLRSLGERLGQFIGQQGDIALQIGNEFASRAIDSYVSSAENDIRENLNRFASEHTGQAEGDLQYFNDKAEAYRKAVVEQSSPVVRGRLSQYIDDSISHKRMGIQSRQIDTERKLQSIDIETNILESQKEGNTYAIDGNLEGALLNYSERIIPLRQQQVARGEISQKSADIMNTYDLKNIQGEFFKGELRRTYESGGALDAMKMVDRFTKSKDTLIGLNEADRAEIQKGLYGELQTLIALDNKIEAEQESQRKTLQEDNAVLVYSAIYSGKDATQDVLQGIANKTLSLDDGKQMLNLIRSQGTGVDDPNLVFTIQQKIVNGDSISDINSVISNNAGRNLTQSTAGQLLQMATNSSSKNPKYSDPKYKAAKEYLNGMLAVRGVFGALDSESEKRISKAELDLFNRSVMGDEDPLIVVNELVDRTELNKSMSRLKNADPSYTPDQDINKYIERQTELLRSGEIDEATYNFRFKQADQLKNMQLSIGNYDAMMSEIIKNER